MDDDRQLVRGVSNAVFLAGSGLAVLLANGILMNPFSRGVLAVAAIGWGIYALVSRPQQRTVGWVSIAAGGMIALFGSLFHNVAGLVGVGLLLAGGISFVGGLLRRTSAR